jgi:hypothetical protein
VLYRVLFHYFDRFLAEYEGRFEKEYGFLRPIIQATPDSEQRIKPILCPQCGGTMKVIAFLTAYAVVDRIIDHLKLTFVADKPSPPHLAYQEVLVAAESSAEYLS